MNLETAKKEIVKRYKYIYENANFILAPYMYEMTEKECMGVDKPYIYLKLNYKDDINLMFEEFLFSDISMEETELFKFVNENKNNKNYLEKVKKGMQLVEKANEGKPRFMHIELNFWNILDRTVDYVSKQSGDLKNKNNKLKVLDEYFRIGRYKNNGKIYTSGVKPELHDFDSVSVPLLKKEPTRDKKDIGIKENSFIMAIVNASCYEYNSSIFSEREKQAIYLGYHDELPNDLEINCAIEEQYIETMIETRLQRPENTNPCGENFVIKENEIFINPNDILYRYYQVCPHCGFIVNIPKEILSDGLKQRIEDRCSKDDKLFRKMYLYSELFSLDKLSEKGQKTLLLKNKK